MILFLGDCNTLGTPTIEGQAYPEQYARLSGKEVLNCGHTMTTTREGCEYFSHCYHEKIELLCIQYGLVDSWLTFRHAPYVLYYPDGKLRKLGRKLVKKFKKWCKKLGLNRLFGTSNVVPLDEYCQRIESMIRATKDIPVVLIETVPNKDLSRNAEIERYNAALHQIAAQHERCEVLALYQDFNTTQRTQYCDPTHISVAGHSHVAQKLNQLIESLL